MFFQMPCVLQYAVSPAPTTTAATPRSRPLLSNLINLSPWFPPMPPPPPGLLSPGVLLPGRAAQVLLQGLPAADVLPAPAPTGHEAVPGPHQARLRGRTTPCPEHVPGVSVWLGRSSRTDCPSPSCKYPQAHRTNHTTDPYRPHAMQCIATHPTCTGALVHQHRRSPPCPRLADVHLPAPVAPPPSP